MLVIFMFLFIGRVFDKIQCSSHVIKCPVKSTILVWGDAIVLHNKVEGVKTNVQYMSYV